MNSYVLLAVKVELPIDKALDSAGEIIQLMEMQGITGVTVLNTIPAPSE